VKRWVISIILILSLALVGGAGYMGFQSSRPKANKTMQAPPTVPVTRGDVQQTVTAPGQLIGTQETMLEMRVGGRLTEVTVRPGDAVKKGDVLARVDTLMLESAVRDAQAQLEQSRFKLQKAKRATESGAELAAAAKSLEAARLGVLNAQGNYSSTLLKADVTTEVQQAKFWADYWAGELEGAYLRMQERPQSESRLIQYEEAGARAADAHQHMLEITQDAQNNLTAARRSLAASEQVYLSALTSYDSLKNGDPVREAELQVMLDETKLTKAQIELENATLVAPYDGVVLEVKARAGETVAAGSGVVLLSNPSAVEVKSTVIEEDLPLVQPGQIVELYFDARSDAVVKGRVARIIPQRLSGDRPLYPVAIALDEIPTGLAPGMTADASIIVARHADVLRLPRALVRARSDGTAQVQVWLGDHAEARTVKIGLRGDQYVEILEGLREGDMVVGK